MAYRNGERKQMTLFPSSIENYVKEEDPVRAYDAFIEALDLKELGIEINPNKVGNSEYNPKAMLKLFTYGCSYGWKSSRKLERATYHNISFIWLMGGLKPDHKTIAEFRRNNKEALKKTLRQCVRLCLKLELVEGNILFTDGTKIRANAARGKNYTKKGYEKKLIEIDKRIEKLFHECERIDNEESSQESLVKMKEELCDSNSLRKKIEGILEQFKEKTNQKDTPISTINQTDSDSRLMKSVQGSHASYNVQSVVDEKNGLIVGVDAVSKGTDHKQLSKQIKQAQIAVRNKCKVACADSGYADTKDLAEVEEKGVKVIVPNQQQALKKDKKPFTKEEFRYDKESDSYHCPGGHILKYTSTNKYTGARHYTVTSKYDCLNCKNYGVCTKARKGRRIQRLPNEDIKERLAKQYEEPKSQNIYKKRKMLVEHPFGHIKRNLGLQQFLLRGRDGVIAEIALAAACFNISRMINLVGGVRPLVLKLQGSYRC